MAALRNHIAIAAGIFLPAPRFLKSNHAGDASVEEIAVMAHQQHRTGVIRDQFLQ